MGCLLKWNTFAGSGQNVYLITWQPCFSAPGPSQKPDVEDKLQKVVCGKQISLHFPTLHKVNEDIWKNVPWRTNLTYFPLAMRNVSTPRTGISPSDHRLGNSGLLWAHVWSCWATAYSLVFVLKKHGISSQLHCS